MMNVKPVLEVVNDDDAASGAAEEARLDLVFAALSDPIRRRVLQEWTAGRSWCRNWRRCSTSRFRVSRATFRSSCAPDWCSRSASGRISRCSLDVGPLFDAALWLNRYSKYWQEQFGLMAAMLSEIDERQEAGAAKSNKKRKPRKIAHPK